MPISPEILDFMRVAIFYSVVSILYKRNAMFVIANDIILAMTAGMAISTSVLQLRAGIMKGIELGQALYFIPVIYGALYITFFIPQVRYAFRIVSTTNTAATIGLMLPVNFAIVYASIYSYSRLARGAIDVLMLVMFLITLTTWTFAAWLEKPLTWPRRLGFYIIYTFCALQLAPNVFKFGDNLFTVVHISVSSFPAILAPLALIAWLAYDLIRTGQIPFLKAPSKAK